VADHDVDLGRIDHTGEGSDDVRGMTGGVVLVLGIQPELVEELEDHGGGVEAPLLVRQPGHGRVDHCLPVGHGHVVGELGHHLLHQGLDVEGRARTALIMGILGWRGLGRTEGPEAELTEVCPWGQGALRHGEAPRLDQGPPGAPGQHLAAQIGALAIMTVRNGRECVLETLGVAVYDSALESQQGGTLTNRCPLTEGQERVGQLRHEGQARLEQSVAIARVNPADLHQHRVGCEAEG